MAKKTPAKKREAEAEKLLGPCIRCGSNETTISRNYGFATGEVKCLTCGRRWDKETLEKLAAAKAAQASIPAVAEDSIEEEVDSRVRAELANGDEDSDKAMYLRQDIRNEVRAERRKAHDEMVKKNVEAMTPTQKQKWEHERRLARDFPGIEKEVHTLFFKDAFAGATTDERLKLLWGFIQVDQIDFGQFKRLVKLINCPEDVG